MLSENIYDIWSKRLIISIFEYYFNEKLNFVDNIPENTYLTYKLQHTYATNYYTKFIAKNPINSSNDLIILLLSYYNEFRIDEIDLLTYFTYFINIIQLIDITIENTNIHVNISELLNTCQFKRLDKKILITTGYIIK